ncbi:hypothetical protein NE237_010329 [Protea cynaroides]|uniref:Uncharacterized protein n=1 Tax=Protea cynaroides TaxID=273540 RepID=A0A9Q0KZJ2_9MAGN|nr:hypothetical protein NE237_010329 [Protea cynaroides]
MEDDPELDFGAAHAAPALVSVSSFSSSFMSYSRRLLSHFSALGRPNRAARQLPWISLQGRLVGMEEATSVKSIGGSLSPEESLAWELFSPMHRILIVAVVAAAAADSKKSREIWKLRKSVQLRDEFLSSMQQKLDDLCDEENILKDLLENEVDMSPTNNKEILSREIKPDEAIFLPCGCQLCYEHRVSSIKCDFVEKLCSGDEVDKFKMPPANGGEQEERRMSDLSDSASSVTSSADIQLNTLAIEQDTYNLQRECKEKDATIKELSAVVHATDAASSKRMAELEDIIRRKNMIITKLKKDMAVLEQKVVHLTRLQRPSFSASNSNVTQLPIMADNLLYDMDFSTSSSSSDSDFPIRSQSYELVHEDEKRPALEDEFALNRDQMVGKANTPISLPRLVDCSQKQQSEPIMTLRQRHLVPSSRDMKRSRRLSQTVSKDKAQHKRWVYVLGLCSNIPDCLLLRRWSSSLENILSWDTSIFIGVDRFSKFHIFDAERETEMLEMIKLEVFNSIMMMLSTFSSIFKGEKSAVYQ